jgi:hypothetical protein
MVYHIGKKYNVCCAKLRWKDDEQIYYIPVFKHLHADPQFGVIHQHYHIDGRFEIHPRMRHWLKINNGHTASVIVTHAQSGYIFEGIQWQSLKFERFETGLFFDPSPNEKQIENRSKYNEWYLGYIGHQCKGRRCPHYGTEMLEKDGNLVCPLHHLTADLETLKIIPAKN